MSRTRRITKAFGLGCLTVLPACASMKTPENIEAAATGGAYQAQYREPLQVSSKSSYLQSRLMNEGKCLPYIGGAPTQSIGKWQGPDLGSLLGEKLSRGDIVQVKLEEDDVFSGTFVVSRDGMLKLPFLDPVPAQGRSTDQVEADLTEALIAAEFYDVPPRLSLRISDFASVTVGVSGSVFEAHAVEVGGVPGASADRERQTNMGSSTEGRNLSAALRAAGGIRPDADLSAVELHREGRVYRMDLRGVFEGTDPTDIMLLTGDEIVVKSRQCFQDDLMRPSPVSPPGISLYLSNLTQPATGNAESAIGRDVRQVPYGTRYMQAVVDSNCVGGAKVSNANRSAVLFSRNPETEVSVVIERNIEQLLRRADRDDYDPYLLPGDAIACYDSKVTNLAEVGRVMGSLAGGLLLIQ